MAKYNVQVTAGDGEVFTVPVEADSIAEARRKALVGQETNSTAGTPVLDANQGTLAETGFREKLPGESTTDYLRYRAGLKPKDLSVSPSFNIDPDLNDPNSSTYVPDSSANIYTPETFTNFANTLDPNANTNLTIEELNPDLFDTSSSSFFTESVPPVTTPPVITPPVITPPVITPPAIGGQGGFNNDPALQAEIDRLTALGLSREEASATAMATMQARLDDLNAQINNQLSNVGLDAANQGVPGAVAGSLPFNISDQDLFGVSSDAGYKRAFGNVFGNEVTSRGPLAGYFDRQRGGLTNAFRSKSLVDYLNDFGLDQGLANAGAGGTLVGPTRQAYGSGGTPAGAVGAVGPGAVGPSAFDPTAAAAVTNVPNVLQDQFVPQSGSFEDFLRQSQSAPTGLNSAYTNALANYGTLRNLSASQAPESLSYLFSPEQFNDVQNPYGLLQAAQRGKYSPLVSDLFRTPSYEDTFGDYTLASQDRAKQGLGSQNFLDFAGSRFGL